MILKNCRFIITQDPQRRILEHYDILVENAIIKEISQNINSLDQEIIDCSHKIVMPGLINTHGHHSMALLRGVCDDEELDQWLARVVPSEEKMTTEELSSGSALAIEEMISCGTTTCVEMYWPIMPFFEQVKKSGMRAVMMPVLSDKFTHMCSDISLVEESIKKYRLTSPLVSWAVSAHSIYGCSEELLKNIASLAKKYGLMKGMHIAETRQERFECQKQKGVLPIEFLERTGCLDEKTLLAHAVWITKEEIKILGKHNVKISHCPVSNMKLASGGVMPLPEMILEGVVVSLGTDSVASNNSLDLFEEMKITGLLHKHHRWDPTTTPVQKIIDMATLDGATCLGMEKQIGSIERGKQADMITIDLQSPRMKPVNNILSNIVYSARGGDVVDVMVAGRILTR